MQKAKPALQEEVEDFYNQLKKYKDSYEKKTASQDEEKEAESLREELVRESGKLEPLITQLTRKRYFIDMGRTLDVWSCALSKYVSPPQALDTLLDIVNEARGRLESDAKQDHEEMQKNVPEKLLAVDTGLPKAFIAHGGESPALEKLKAFLEALGVQPLVVEEQASQDRSVGENLDWYSKQADCAIILATKGDIDGKTGEFIPRGNVLHEIGRFQEVFRSRIIYLLEEGTKFPSNVSEKVWEGFSSQCMDKAFIKVVRELKAFGLIKSVKPNG